MLTLLRLILLFNLSCFLAMVTALFYRDTQERGWGLAPAVAAIAPPGSAIPFLGINIDLAQVAPSPQRIALQRLRQAGFGWVRQRFDWGLLEPTPGAYHWQTSDALLQAIEATELIPMIVLDGSPAWARAPVDVMPTANPLAPPADPATFARFVAAFAARYQDTLRYYQLWDEPNIAPHWGNRMIEPVAYAQLLKAVVPALRAADPDAVVITAALAPTRDRGHLAIDEVYFLERLYAAGAAPFFDVVAAQPFGFGYTPDDTRARTDILNFQRVKLLRRTMRAAGDGHKPLWAVRYGWNTYANSPWRTVRPADQTAFATRALTIAAQQWPWLTAMGWALDQPAAPSTDPSWGFALTPALADAFHTWQAMRPHDMATPSPATFNGWPWVALLMSWLFILWRAIAALRILPWTWWQRAYLAWPSWVKVTLWLAVVSFYYFVTWPPLIVGGWLLVTLLMLPIKAVGLGFVALLLPFYFQHKEVALLSGTLKMPPAHVALLCLWLAQSSRAYATVSVAAKERIGPWVKQLHGIDWLALGWMFISLCTALHVWYWPAYRQGIIELVILPLLVYWATRLLATTPARQQQIGLALFGGGLLAAIIGLGMWSLGQGTSADGVLRLVGPYFSPNHTALYLERTWWLGLGLVLTWHGRRRDWGWLALAVVGVALWLTASRGAWLLGMPAGALVFGWTAGLLQRDRYRPFSQLTRRTALIGLSGAASLLLLVGAAFRDTLWLRLTNSATIVERLAIWQATLQLWQEHWLLGVGPGGFFWRYPSYLAWSLHAEPNLLHPHNLWLEVLAGWGALGLLWFLLMGWQVWRLGCTVKSSEQPAWQASGLVAALAASMAHGQADTFGALPDLALWNWLVLGLLVNMIMAQSRQPNKD